MSNYSSLAVGSRLRLKPFPKLWQAFATDEAILNGLNNGIPFETACEADRLLAIRSPVAARAVLARYLGLKAEAGTVAPEIPQPGSRPPLSEFPEHLLKTDLLRGNV